VYNLPVDRVRSQLREAAREFADKMYEELREALRAEVRRELSAEMAAVKGRPAGDAPGTRRRRPALRESAARSPACERVLAFVQAHPGVRTMTLIAALALNRPIVVDALAEGIEAGVLAKQGSGPRARFFPAADDTRSEGVESARGLAERNRRRLRIDPPQPRDLVSEVSKFVADHPGCRFAEIAKVADVSTSLLGAALRKARERRTILMVGRQTNARYFPGEPKAKRGRGKPSKPSK
jgi:hypothetical protein